MSKPQDIEMRGGPKDGYTMEWNEKNGYLRAFKHETNPDLWHMYKIVPLKEDGKSVWVALYDGMCETAKEETNES